MLASLADLPPTPPLPLFICGIRKRFSLRVDGLPSCFGRLRGLRDDVSFGALGGGRRRRKGVVYV